MIAIAIFQCIQPLQIVTVYFHQNIMAKSSAPRKRKKLDWQIERLQNFCIQGKCSSQSVMEIFNAFTSSKFTYDSPNSLEFEMNEFSHESGSSFLNTWIKTASLLALRCQKYDCGINSSANYFMRYNNSIIELDTFIYFYTAFLHLMEYPSMLLSNFSTFPVHSAT